MKKLLFIGIALFLVMAPMVYATGNIAYVSQTYCIQKVPVCDCYTGTEDYYYCNALSNNLNYNIKVINEKDVMVNNSAWYNVYPTSELIFLGNVSTKMVLNDSIDAEEIADANQFYDNIFDVINSSNTTVFSTEINNYQNKSIKGFFFRTKLLNFSGTNNSCSNYDGDGFSAMVNNLITNGFPDESTNIKIYTKPNNFSVYEPILPKLLGDTDGWIGFSCEPGELGKDIYPVIVGSIPLSDITDFGTFWGLNTPSLYTPDAWTLFYRAVGNAMGDLGSGSNIAGDIRTNLGTYKPRNSPNITFETSSTITSINLSLTYPDGSLINIGYMDRESDGWRLDNYIIEDDAPSGTYIITANAISFVDKKEFTKTIVIQPYAITTTTNKLSYYSGENVNITMITSEIYKSTLNITAKIDIINPNSSVTNIHNGTLTISLIKVYKIPSGSTGGKYIVNITLNDSDKRIFVIEKNFIVDLLGNLTITPKIWNAQTTTAGNKTQSFGITNTGQVILNLSITTDNPNITVDKTNLTIDIGKTGNFTGTFMINSPGYYTGNIILNSTYVEYLVASTANFSYQLSANSLVISPSSVSIITVPGKTISKEFELENTASISASDIVYKISDSLKNIITLTNVTSSIGASGTSAIKIKISSAGLSAGNYDGTVQINSSIGSTSLTVKLEIISDLGIEADTKLTELKTLQEEITALQKKGKDVTALNALYDGIKTKLESIKTSYGEENYEEAKNIMQEANTSITELKTMITDVTAQKKNYSGIIWAVAIVVILIIVAVVAYKYKDEILNKLSKKQETNENYQPQSQGDYRTEYY